MLCFRVVAWLFFVAFVSSPWTAAAEDEKQGRSLSTAGHYFCKYRPNYMALGVAENGSGRPTTKFQFSFRYTFFDAGAMMGLAAEAHKQPNNSPTGKVFPAGVMGSGGSGGRKR